VLFPGSEAGRGTFGVPCVLGPFADTNILSIGGLRKPDSVESSAREELIPSKLRGFTFGTLISIMLLHLGVDGVLSSEDVSPEVVSSELYVRDFCISPHEKPVQLGLVIASGFCILGSPRPPVERCLWDRGMACSGDLMSGATASGP